MAETILILEDDPGIAVLQQRILERAGYAAERCSRTDEARSRIERGGVDLLLLDNRLEGGAEGLIFYRELKDAGLDLPVILVTGFSDDATAIRALREGVADYVTKSAEYLAYLPEAVRRALDQVRTRRQIQETNDHLHQALEELRITTQQLWQSAKLASVGELAASMAHELNNPLATISLRLEGVLAKTASDDPRRPALEIVEQETERMTNLVANLLQFSRPGKSEASSVDVGAEVGGTLNLMQPSLRRRGVGVRTEFGPDPVRIHADRQKLRQVLLNLITNSSDAMPSGGTLTLRVRRQTPDGGQPVVVVEVIDTGHGIPPELLPKVMEAFFTTKEEGKGTGLGLAICRRIVQEHRGTFEIESTPGQGTTVRITLPATNGTNVNGLEENR